MRKNKIILMLSIVFCLPLFLTGCSLNANKKHEVYSAYDEWNLAGTYDCTYLNESKGVLSEENEKEIEADIFDYVINKYKEGEYDSLYIGFDDFYIDNNTISYKVGGSSSWRNRPLEKINDNTYKMKMSEDDNSRYYLIERERDNDIHYVVARVLDDKDDKIRPGVFVSIGVFINEADKSESNN